MGLSCRIIYKNGVASVFNADGTPSELYAEALKQTGNQEDALNIWAVAYTDEYVASAALEGDSATFESVMSFLDARESRRKTLTPELRNELKAAMRANGFAGLSELHRALVKVFKPQGIATFNETAVSKKIYSAEDLREIDTDKVDETITAIEGELAKGKDITVTPDKAGGRSFSKSDKKSPIGTNEKLTSEEVEQEIIAGIKDFSNAQEIDKAVDNHPFKDAIDSPGAFKSFLKTLRRIPVVTYNGVEVTEDNLNTARETITTIKDSAEKTLKVELITLNKYSDEVWAEKKDAVKRIISEMEAELSLHGVDIIGLSKSNPSRQDMIDMFSSLVEFLETSEDTAIRKFATIKDKYVTPRPNTVVKSIDPAYNNLDIVYSDTLFPDNHLFETEGLIRVGENLYHRIDRENNNMNKTAEEVYNMFLDGQINIPTEVEDIQDPNNKEQIIKDIFSYAAQMNTGYKTNHNVEVALLQMAFAHKNYEKKNHIQEVGHIKTKKDYLKNQFVGKFYDYVLKEKLKDSFVYRTILSKFKFNENGISLDGEVKSIEDISMRDELVDYIRLRRESDMKHLLPSMVGKGLPDVIVGINNPDLVPEYTSINHRYKDYVITASTRNNLIKLNGQLYRKAAGGNGMSVFIEVNMTPSPFYNLDTKAEYDKVEVQKIIEDQMFSFAKPKKTAEERKEQDKANKINPTVKKVTAEDLQEKKEVEALTAMLKGLDDTPAITAAEYVKSKKLGNNPQLIAKVDKLFNKDTTKLVAEYLKQRFGTDISILSNEYMKVELSARGYDSVSPMIVGTTITEIETEWLDNLGLAKDLQEKGTDAKTIKQLTGWELYNGDWKLEIPEPSLKVETLERGIQYSASDVFDTARLEKIYPNIKNLKIELTDGQTSSYNRGTNIIKLGTDGVLTQSVLTGDTNAGSFGYKNLYRLSGKLERTLSHELTHFIQSEEDFYIGGSPNLILQLAAGLSGVTTQDSTSEIINKISKKAQETNLAPSDKSVLVAANNYFTMGDFTLTEAYERLVGEIEARNIQGRFDFTSEQRKGLLLSDTEEYFPEENKIYVKAAQVDGIQFLSTNDKIYGFYDGATGKIFLTEEFLNSNALIHEHYHLFKPLLKHKAAKGDTDAKLLLETISKIAEDSKAFNQAEFEARYDRKINTGVEMQFSVLGEQGAGRLEGIRRLDNLEIAKELEDKGEDAKKIKLLTEWERGVDGKWKYEVSNKDFKLNPKVKFEKTTAELFDNPIEITTLADLVTDNILFKAYPGLKDSSVIIYKNEDKFAEAEMFNLGNDFFINGEIFTTADIKSQSALVRARLLYEIQHNLQTIEGFSDGTNVDNVRSQLYDIINRYSEGGVESIEGDGKFKSASKILQRTFGEETVEGQMQLLSNDWVVEYIANGLYTNNAGEVEARNVESRLGLTEEQLRTTLLADTADVSVEDQDILFSLVSPAGQLSSDVYNPRPGESKEDYIDRMREEVEANLLGANSEEYFKRIAEENRLTPAETKSFLAKIKAFIDKFSFWLSKQLGFQNITPEQAAKLTTKEALDRITTSMLRNDFGPLDFEKVFEEPNSMSSEMFSAGITTSVEISNANLRNAQEKARGLAMLDISGFKLLIDTNIKNIEDCK